MKNHTVTIVATLLGLSLLGSARAESWNSKLADMVAAAAAGSETPSGEQTVAAPLANDAGQQTPMAAPTQSTRSNAQEQK